MKSSITRRGNKLRVVLDLDLDQVLLHLYPASMRLEYIKRLRKECLGLPKEILEAADVLVDGDQIGEVKFFLKEKGYGFITYNYRDVFVHQKHLAEDFRTLEPGQSVRFKLRTVLHEGKEREEAVDVTPLVTDE